MYNLNFEYSDKIVNNLLKLEGHKLSIKNLDLSYTVRQKLTLRAKTLDLFHLANLLKTPVTLKEAEKLSINKSLDSVPNTQILIIQNFRNALEFNKSSIADTYAEIDKTVLLHLNKLVLANWRESWDVRLRNFNEEFSDENIFSPLIDNSIENIGSYIDDIIEWYRQNSMNIPYFVRISILIAEMVRLHPFYNGNLLSILAFIDYLLNKNNLAGKSYFSVVRIFDNNKDKFVSILQMSLQSHDLSTWVEYFTECIIDELLSTREEINKYILEDENSKRQPFLDLNKRQLKVLKYMQNVPTIKREDYCHMMEVSTMTAFRDLDELVRKKLLKVEGKGRGTKYRLANM